MDMDSYVKALEDVVNAGGYVPDCVLEKAQLVADEDVEMMEDILENLDGYLKEIAEKESE